MKKQNLTVLHLSLSEISKIILGLENELKKTTTALNINSQKKNILALIQLYQTYLHKIITLHPKNSENSQVIAAELKRWQDITEKIKMITPVNVDAVKKAFQTFLSHAKAEISIAKAEVQNELRRAA